MIDSFDDVRVLNAGPQPDVRQNLSDLPGDHVCHSVRALGQDLVVVVWGAAHHLPHPTDERVTDALMEEVTHRVDEYLARLFPIRRNVQRSWVLANHAVPNRALAAA